MPTVALDQRIVNVTIQLNSGTKTYMQPMMIKVTGTKYANALQNEAEITIANIDKQTQDYLLTETSPYNLNRTPKSVTVSAGRQSYGTSVIYTGNIVTSRVTQPPDIGIVLKCLTGNFFKSTVISRGLAGQTKLSQIVKGIANDLNLLPNFQATDKNISNYNFSGAALKQVDLLNTFGNTNAFIDNNTLYVKNAAVPLTGVIKVLNAQTGMIGIPEFTEWGLKVKFLIDNQTTIGGGLRITSQVYPAINGLYVIYKLGFDIATRDTPFYYTAEARRISS